MSYSVLVRISSFLKQALVQKLKFLRDNDLKIPNEPPFPVKNRQTESQVEIKCI